MFFLPAIQTQGGTWIKGDVTKIRDLAQGWAMRTGYEVKARDAVVLYADDEAKLAALYATLTTGNLDEKRETLERGEGGDHDQPYAPGLPNALVAQRGWAQMIASVRAGELGGEDDGAD